MSPRQVQNRLRQPHAEDDSGQRSLLAGSAILLILVAGDVALGSRTVITLAYGLAPLVTAFWGNRRSTVLISIAAVSLAALSGIWNANVQEADQFGRIALVIGASGMAIVGSDAIGRSRESLRRLTLLNEVAKVADGSSPLAETMDRISDVIVPGFADVCVIDVISDGQVTRVATRVSGPGGDEFEEVLAARIPNLPTDITDSAASHKSPARLIPRLTDEMLRDLAHDEADLIWLRAFAPHSAITVPLSSRGSKVGALTLVSTWSKRRYAEEDARFVETLGGRVALALDNAGLFLDLQSIEQRMDSVMSVLDQAVVIHDSRGSLIFANAAALKMFNVEDPATVLGADNVPVQDRFDFYDENGDPFRLEESPLMAVLDGEKPDPQTIRIISRITGREAWLRAKTQGVSGPAGASLYAVTALEDLTDIKKEEFAHSLLARISEVVHESPDYEQTIRNLAELSVPQLADWCSIYVPRPADGTLAMVAVAHMDAARRELARTIAEEIPISLDDRHGPAEVLRSGEAIVVEDVASELESQDLGPRLTTMVRKLDLGSAMILPLSIGDRNLGTFHLANETGRRPYNSFDRDLGERLAARIAIALESSLLASERATIASDLQQGLLPAPIPRIEGWSVATLYRPAGVANEVGGDFYDAFTFRGGWMVVMGDVTGRGSRAASVTGLARQTLRTASALTGDPIAALGELNRALLARDDTSLCSVVAIALRQGSGREISMAVAGHPPPLCVCEGRLTEIMPTGPVLGAFANPSWDLREITLGTNEQLVVYTDGVTEASGRTERFGEDRLQESVRGTTSPQDAVKRVEAALEDFCREGLDDDAAVLALQPIPPEPPISLV